MISILSTKRLTPSQKNLILGAGFSVVEYDAIDIEFADFKLPQGLEYLIFTSKNAVTAFLKKIRETKAVNNSIRNTEMLLSAPDNSEIENYKCFCIGPKTEALLVNNGFEVIKSPLNAKELAYFITEKYNKDHFSFFCGGSRRAELPQILKEHSVSFEEIKVYTTLLKSMSFKQHFDALLFFSPSGVQSFIANNHLKNTLAVCIGSTTAAEAQKHTANFTIANDTTIESVIARAVKALNKQTLD